MVVLPDAEDRTIVCLFIWTKHRNVADTQIDRRTDRRTDRHISSGYYSTLWRHTCWSSKTHL